MTQSGVLLCNLGGPTHLAEVRPFLFRLFSDPDILVGIPTPIRILLALFISLVKGHSSKKAYQQIGGGSPQVTWTRKQAELLEARLNGVPVAFGMRAWNPSLREGLEQLRKRNVTELTVLPLFPHFSTTTTGSCFKEIQHQFRQMNWFPKVRWIRSWPDHPGYIQLLLRTIDEVKMKMAGDYHLLISAHSLPLKIVARGDPYPSEIEKTIKALVPHVHENWSLAFQSRNGPIPWLRPYVETKIPELAASGVRSLIVLPISFVSDHIETLFELDREYAHLAKSVGIESYFRTRAFNADPEFIEILADLYACSDSSTGIINK